MQLPPNKFAGTKPETIFPLTNGRIVLCGYVENKDSERLFSEFVLAVCGQDKLIDFWGAQTVCRITTHKNVLTEYEHLNKKLTYDNMDLVYKLFVAAISGTKLHVNI